VLVYSKDKHVLLLERADVVGFWQSVTGALKVNESAAMCAARELLEETGIDAQPVDQQYSNRFEISGAWRSRYNPGDTHNAEHVFSVLLTVRQAVKLNPAEHTRFQWLSASDAVVKASSSTNQEAIKRVVLDAQV